MKTLFVCLGTYQTKDASGIDADNFDRQLLYAIALTRLSHLVDSNSGILVVENSSSSISELNLPLQKALSLPQITEVLFSQNNSVGIKNKGAGEYGMCKYAYEKRRQLFDGAEWVVYYTHRHTMPFPLVFNYLEKYGTYDAIVSSAEYFYPDGSSSQTAEGLFDDLIFAMKKDVFVKYVENMDPEILIKKRIGSEQNLYQFLKREQISYKQVERFGVCRYNYFADRMEVI